MFETTPGPWHVEMLTSTAAICGRDGGQILFIVPLDVPEKRAQREADARLAARAPELEESLDILETAIDEACDDSTIARINAIERRLAGECFHCGERHACHACGKVHFDLETEPACRPTNNRACHLRAAV